MESPSPSAKMDIDFAKGAKLHDFRLTEATPLYADSNLFRHETPLEIEVHAGIEVGVLLAGAEEHQLDDWVCHALPGDIWLTAMWEPHGWRVAAPNTEDVLLIFLPGFLGEEQLGHLSWLDLFAVPPSQRPRVTTPKMRDRVVALGRDLRHEVEQRRPGWESAVKLGLLGILLTLSRDWEPPARPKVRSRARASSLPRIMPALNIAQSRRARRVTVAEAAEACALGRAQFCLLFQDAMGMSFGRFCQRSRLGHVAELLLSTDLTMSAIARRSGFADSSHMYRAFGRHHGCTPGEYRARHRRE